MFLQKFFLSQPVWVVDIVAAGELAVEVVQTPSVARTAVIQRDLYYFIHVPAGAEHLGTLFIGDEGFHFLELPYTFVCYDTDDQIVTLFLCALEHVQVPYVE